MRNSSDPDEETYLLDISRRAMACQFQILLNADEQHSSAETAVEALDLVEELEAQLSIFRTESQITRINQLAAENPQTISPEVFQLLSLAKQIWQETDGAFDITSTPLSKAWGFHTRQSTLPLSEDIISAKQSIGCQFLQLKNNAVSFDHPQLEINLGGIGKGYALDRCHQHFSSQQIENYLLHAGHSSILAHGKRKNLTTKNRGWQIALRHPLIPQRQLANVWLQNKAIGTSGDANQFFYHQGKTLRTRDRPSQRLAGTTYPVGNCHFSQRRSSGCPRHRFLRDRTGECNALLPTASRYILHHCRAR